VTDTEANSTSESAIWLNCYWFLHWNQSISCCVISHTNQ